MAAEGNENDNEEGKNINDAGTGAEGGTGAGAGEGSGAGEGGQENSINDEAVLKYIQSKGREVKSIDELFVEREVIKEVNPYGEVNDEMKSLLEYSKNTGRGLNDYLKLQENIDDKPLIDLAIAKVKAEVGGNMSNEALTEYIEDSLGIDLSGELNSVETIKLTKFVKDYKEQLKVEQEKYKTPVKPVGNAATAQEEEMVTLADGQTIPKKELEAYQAHEKVRQDYLQKAKTAVDSVAKFSFTVEYDNNGTKEERVFDYDLDASDKQDMLTDVQDIDQTISKRYVSETGIDHEKLSKGMFLGDTEKIGKIINVVANKVRAETIDEIMKMGNNVNFDRTQMPTQGGKPGVTIRSIKDIFNR